MANHKHNSTRAVPALRVWSSMSDTLVQKQWLETCSERGFGLTHQQAVQLGMLRLEQSAFGAVMLWHTGWLDGVTHDDLTVPQYVEHLDLPTQALSSALTVASPQGNPLAAYDGLFADYRRPDGAGFFFASLRSDDAQAEIDRRLRSCEYSESHRDKVMLECGDRMFAGTFGKRVAKLSEAYEAGSIGWTKIADRPSVTPALHERCAGIHTLCESFILGDTPECLKHLARVIHASTSPDAPTSSNRSRVYRARLALQHELHRDPSALAMAAQLILRSDHLQRQIRVARTDAITWPDWVYEASSPHAASIADGHANDRAVIQLVATAMYGLSRREFSDMRSALSERRGELLEGRLTPAEFVEPIVRKACDHLLREEPAHALDLCTTAFKKVVLKDLVETVTELPFALLRDLGTYPHMDAAQRINRAVFGDAACAVLKERRAHARERLARRLTPSLSAAVEGAITPTTLRTTA